MTTRPILFITGLSGAGISTALKALEDCGYEVFDNFPLTHVQAVIEEGGYEEQPIAFGFDTRTRAFSPEEVIAAAQKFGAKILFLNASNGSLQKRYSETRRKHPRAQDRPVLDGIIHERELLEPLNEHADQRINTSDLTLHDLKRTIQGSFAPQSGKSPLSVTVMSFGFKNGVPREADIVMDVRFLQNPHWVEELQPLTGLDKKVQDHIESDPECAAFIKNFKNLLEPLIPRYAHEGKNYLTIAFGCTGGRHRSVHIAEKIGAWLADTDITVHMKHRDLRD